MPQNVGAVMNGEVRVPDGRGKLVEYQLASAGRALANLLLQVTTKQSAPANFRAQPWWIRPGMPLFFIEYEIGEEIGSFPTHSRRVASLEERLQREFIELAFCRVHRLGQPGGVWFIGRVRGYTDEDVLRRLRIHLSRVHALRESLKQTLRSVVQQQILVSPGSAGTEFLQHHLNEGFRILNKESFIGLQQAPLLETAYSLDHLVGDRATLLHQLEKIRSTILKKVADGTKTTSTPSYVYNFGGESNEFHLITDVTGGIDMSEEKIIVSGVVGPVNIKSRFDHVTQIVSNALAMPDDKREELGNLISELQEALNAVAEQRPDDAQRVVSTAELVATEVVKLKPDKGFLKIAVEGLKNAAQVVEDIAPTVINIATKIAIFAAAL